MIPDLVDLPGSPWPVLPPGIHSAGLIEIETRYATNEKRRGQFRGLVAALSSLRSAGCRRAFLDGSYSTGKPTPGDFDACWDPTGVSPHLLDPVFLKFDDNRAAQKKKFLGEFFPSTAAADAVGTAFIKFFQVDKFTGSPKGIIEIDLTTDPMLNSR